MKRHFKRILAILLLSALLGTGASAALAEEGKGPVSLAKQCVYENANERKIHYTRLCDNDPETYLQTRYVFEAEEWISVRWTDAPVDFVYFEWTDNTGVAPAPFTVELLDADGEVKTSYEGEPYWNNGVAIEAGVKGVRLIPHATAELCTLIPYSGGAPENYHPWQPTVDKADFLVVAMHPDDDTLFMGNVIATYGAEHGMHGTVLYMGTRERVRRTEALNGAWIMGQRTYPLMAGLPDIPMRLRKDYQNDFLQEDVERMLVQYLRRVKPEVVVSHDDNGEYGHWQHIILAAAMRNAVVFAADGTYDPESAAQYGVWQVKKLYLHLAEENPIFISATVPLAAFGGRTGCEIAQEAYACHQSQRLWNHLCNNQDENSLERFGLVYTTVGTDTGLNDLFEHIDPATVSGVIRTAEPTEAPTEAPTETPAPVEAESTPTPTEASTEAPRTEPEQEPEKPVKPDRTAGFLIAGALTLCAFVLLLIGILTKRNGRADHKGLRITLWIAAAVLLLCGAAVLAYTLLQPMREAVPAATPEPTASVTSLTVRSEDDLPALSENASIRTVTVEAGALTNERIAELVRRYPDVAFTYAVRVGDGFVPQDAETVACGDGVALEDVQAALPLLKALKTVTLGACAPERIERAIDLLSPVGLDYTVLVCGTEAEPDAETLDLSEAEELSADALLSALPLLPKLKTVDLGTDTDPDLVAALLDVDTGLSFRYAYTFDYCGRTLSESTETLDLTGVPVTDLDELKTAFARLPKLKHVEMAGCGIPDAEMAALRDEYPELGIVWEISLGFWGKVRTDATAFTTRSSKRPDEMKYRLTTETVQPIQYCTDLVALDLGHQQIEDISCLKSLTKLKVLILADNKISDISALAYMPDLVYVELFMNRISDLTPLSGLRHIKDLNLCTNRISDLTPLYSLTSLERLWYSNNKYTKADHDALQAQLVNCICNRTVWQETDDGWREHERYFWMIDFFKDSPRYR